MSGHLDFVRAVVALGYIDIYITIIKKKEEKKYDIEQRFPNLFVSRRPFGTEVVSQGALDKTDKVFVFFFLYI